MLEYWSINYGQKNIGNKDKNIKIRLKKKKEKNYVR